MDLYGVGMEPPHKRTGTRCVFHAHQLMLFDPESLANQAMKGPPDTDPRRAANTQRREAHGRRSVTYTSRDEPNAVAPPGEALQKRDASRTESPSSTPKTPHQSRDGGTLAPSVQSFPDSRRRRYPHQWCTGQLPWPRGCTGLHYRRRGPSYRAPGGTRIGSQGGVNASDRRP